VRTIQLLTPAFSASSFERKGYPPGGGKLYAETD